MMIESPDRQGLDDFAALYVGQHEQLLRLAVLLVGDVAAAEDVVQEAFIRVHRAVESRSLHNPMAYLRQAVVNLARSGLRRRLVRLRHAPRPMPDAASAEEGACAAISRQTSVYLLPPPAKALAPLNGSTADPAALASQPPAGQPASWDIDGDGRPDTATIVPVGNARTTASFLLVVHLTRFATQTVPFTGISVAGIPPRGPVIVGAADAAHDGHTELFVQVDAGCCTEFWAIFRLVDGHIRQMTTAGRPVALGVGGSLLDNGGFSCAGPDLVVSSYHEQSGGPTVYTFRAIRDTYRWAGAALVLASRQTAIIRGTPADPALAGYSGVSCGSLPQYESVR
jgi:hypothetical protein